MRTEKVFADDVLESEKICVTPLGWNAVGLIHAAKVPCGALFTAVPLKRT